jgi:triosephosphate isomerase
MIAPWPRRPRLVAGNWKMHRTPAEAAALAAAVLDRARTFSKAEVALCPPFPALAAVSEVLRGSQLHLGAQNLHPEPQGAFTGEVSGPMLAAVGCRFVLVGHSERRHGMGEDDALIARKLRAARRDGLIPIVCVGETGAERERAITDAVLARQIESAYQDLGADEAARTVIAYEPVWAIGTGKVATTAEAAAAHRVIRSTLERAVGEGLGAKATILYGGSVNAANAASLFADEEIDGALVGGASLDAAAFWSIVTAA